MNKKVLIVDDSPTIREQVRMAVGKQFEVLEAVDGFEALRKIDDNPDLAIVVCDINMPGMDGFEVLEAMKGRLEGLPVLMLTTEAGGALIRRAKASGARGWIIKPFKPELLLGAIQKLVAK